MNRLILILLIFCSGLSAQNLIWTGSSDDDFFNENNWKEQNTRTVPPTGLIDPGKNIDRILYLTNASANLSANAPIHLGTGELIIEGTTLNATAINGGSILLKQEAYLNLSDDDPLQNKVIIQINSGIAWLRTENMKGEALKALYFNNISINGQAAIYPSNTRLDNYYEQGGVVRADIKDTQALTIYEKTYLKGKSANITVNDIHSGSSIADGMNKLMASFTLKRGYMATLAINNDGTGLSKVYIASEKDLTINELPEYLQNNISFIRVVPWNWVAKKGIGGNTTGFNETWHYKWGNNGTSTIAREYAPMAWGKSGADDDADITLYRNKYKTDHVLAFNESDNCDDQSGKWGNLCQTNVAVATYKNLMKTGLRLISPSCRENAPFGWLKEFYDKATAQDIRIDVIGVHWYDWGSNPKNSPNADPQQVFNRFKNYLTKVHNLYELPIWITEFNANPNRTTAVNKGFMELALPYLESLDYVERYAWYQPNSGVADYYDTQNNYTEVGLVYKNQTSTPSVPAETLIVPNNLDKSTGDKSIVFLDDFESYTNAQSLATFYTVWEGTAYAVNTNQNSTYGLAYEGDGFGRSNNSNNDFALRKTFELEAGKTYQWELATKMTDGAKHSLNVIPTDIYTTKDCTNSDWEEHSMEFTVQENYTSITLALYRWPKKNLYFDNFILKEKASTNTINENTTLGKNDFTIYPNPVRDKLCLKRDKNIRTKNYKIYNTQGQIIMQGFFKEHITVSSLMSGVYLFNLDNKMARFIKI